MDDPLGPRIVGPVANAAGVPGGWSMTDARRPRAAQKTVLALALLAGVLAVLGGLLAARLPACALTPQDQCTRVLFIGNSYTYVNDLPGTFARLAASGGHRVETGMYAPGGAFLADEAADPDIAALISGTRWSAVVLQEQSQRPASTSEAALFQGAATRLAAMAANASARPMLLETWAHRDGWPELGMDYAAMQAAIDRGYASAGAVAGAVVVPAGEAWRRVLAADATVPLWQDDGSHPAAAGTYLAACVLYRTLFGESPVGLGDHEGLPDAIAADLQRAAAGG